MGVTEITPEQQNEWDDQLHHSKEVAQESNPLAVNNLLALGEPVTVRLTGGASTVVSPIDTLFIPKDFTDDQALALVRTSLGMESLDYAVLGKLLKKAKAFYKNFLRMGIPSEIDKMLVENQTGLLKFIGKARLKKEQQEFRFVSPYGPTVCALLKIASAYSQLDRKSYSEYRLIDTAMSSRINNQIDFVEGVDEAGHHYREYEIRDRRYDRPRTINAKRLSPGDLENMFLTKMLSEPSYDAQSKLMEGPVEYQYVESPEDIYSLILLHCDTINRKNPLPQITFYIGSNILSGALKTKLTKALDTKSIQYRFTDLKGEKVERCTIQFEMGIVEDDGAPHKETKRKITFDFQLKNSKNLSSNRYVNQAQNMLEAVCRLHGAIGPTYLRRLMERVSTLTEEKVTKVQSAAMKGYVPLGFSSSREIKQAMTRNEWHPRYLTEAYAVRLAGQGLLAKQADRMATETRKLILNQIQKRQ